MQEINNTQYFKVEKGPELRVSDVLAIVYRALMEKGYNPVNQIVGYIMSGTRCCAKWHFGRWRWRMAISHRTAWQEMSL